MLKKDWIFRLLLILILIVFFLFLDWLLHFSRIHNYVGYDEVYSENYVTPRFPKLTTRQIVNLGWAHRYSETATVNLLAPKSSYLNFKEQKKEDVIRIGVFGCSFTEGTESGYGYDYPSRLQDRFNRAGYSNIEVINFGVGSYGMHQSYLLYQYLGKKYNLDIMILNPLFLHLGRDTRFCHDRNYLGVHARYIIQGDSLKPIEVLGDSRLEAAQIYHRLFPPWRYVRYNMKSPNFLPVNKKWNPFYYTKAKSEPEAYPEILKTYERIFRSFAKNVLVELIVCDTQMIYNLKDSIKRSNIIFYKFSRFFNHNPYSLYSAECGHYSPFGNQYVADQIFNILTQSRDSINYISFGYPDTNQKYNSTQSLPPLHEYDSVFFALEKYKYNTLYKRLSMDEFGFCHTPVDLSHSEIASLLILSPQLTDAAFYPIEKMLSGSEKVFLTFEVGNEKHKLKIGKVNTINPYIYSIQFTDTISSEKNRIITLEDNTQNLFKDICINGNTENVKNLEVYIGTLKFKTSIYEQKSDQPDNLARYHLNLNKDILVFRTHQDQYFHLQKHSKGEMRLVLVRNNQQTQYPLFSWEVDKKAFKPILSKPFPPIFSDTIIH